MKDMVITTNPPHFSVEKTCCSGVRLSGEDNKSYWSSKEVSSSNSYSVISSRFFTQLLVMEKHND